jgi:hypothetical protein
MYKVPGLNHSWTVSTVLLRFSKQMLGQYNQTSHNYIFHMSQITHLLFISATDTLYFFPPSEYLQLWPLHSPGLCLARLKESTSETVASQGDDDMAFIG